jgi:hypothetical protein
VTESRDPETIQREIEQTRAQLASTLDELAERASPKRVASRGAATLTGTTRGRAIIGGIAGVLVALVGLRVTRRRKH